MMKIDKNQRPASTPQTIRQGRSSVQPQVIKPLQSRQNQRSSLSSNDDQDTAHLQRLKKTAFLESAVYNPQNYLFNTNYNREFGDKIRSEGANYLRKLGAKHGQGPTVTRNMAAAARTAQPSARGSGDLTANSKLNKQDYDIKRNAIKVRLNTHAFRNFQ